MIQKNFSKFSILILLGILLFGCLAIAEGTTENNEEKDIDYYLNKEKVAEFSSLTNEEKDTVLKSATPEQRELLFRHITARIYVDKISSASGYTAEALDSASKEGQARTDYPEELKFIGFDNDALKWSGGEDMTVIGDEKLYLNLETIPGFVNEIEYKSEKGKSSFILKGKDGQEIILEKGSTNENGSINFIASRDGKIGDQRISSDLNDYNVLGKVRITEEGFVLDNYDSTLEYKDFTFVKSASADSGKIDFTDYGVDLTGAEMLKEGQYAVRPKDPKKPFKVVFGSDWSPIMGEKEYKKSLTFEDVGVEGRWIEEYHSAATMAPGVATGRRTYVTTEKDYGELDIIPSKNGKTISFKKTVGAGIFSSGKTYTIDPTSMTLAELQASIVYKKSSSTMQSVMEAMNKDPTKANMQYVQGQMYSSSRIRVENYEMYKDFLSIQTGFDMQPGAAFYNGVDGKLNILASPGNVGADINLYNDVNMLAVANSGSAAIKLNVNPGKEGGMDITFQNGRVKTKKTILEGPPRTFEYGIDEIRMINHDGGFDAKNTRALIKKGKDWKVIWGKEVTVMSAVLNPYANSLVINNGEVAYDLPLPVSTYLRTVEGALNVVKKLEGDAEFFPELVRNVNKLYDQSISKEQREAAQKTVNDFLATAKTMDAIPQKIRDGLPNTLPLIPDPSTVEKGVVLGEVLTGDLRSFVKRDLQKLRDNPFIGEVTMKITNYDSEANQFGGDINDFADDLANANFVVDVSMKVPEFETFRAIGAYADIIAGEGSSAAGTLIVNKGKNAILRTQIAESLVDGALGQSRTLPGFTIQGTIGSMTEKEKTLTLAPIYREELRNKILDTLNDPSFTIQGETHLIMRNIPSQKRVEVSLVNGDQTKILTFQNPSNRATHKNAPRMDRFLHDVIVASTVIPEQDLTGYQVRGSLNPFSGGLFWKPSKFINAYDVPIITGGATYRSFCNSVGYRASTCSDATQTRFKNLEKKYFSVYQPN